MDILADPVPVLQKYLQIDTTDSQNDDKACQFWESIFSQYQIKNRILKSGNYFNFETFTDSPNKEKILMQNHLDVVSANRESWKYDPFGGIIDGYYLYGRGALDMKSIGVMQAYAHARLARENHPGKNLLKFCSMVQEETTAEHGAKFYVEHLKRQNYENLIVLGEGGFGLRIPDIFNGIMFLYESEQKGLLWLSITVHSAGGHGSVGGNTKRNNPVIRASKVAQKLSAYSFPIKIEDSVRIFIEKVSNQSNNRLLQIISFIPFIKKILFETKIGARILNRIITDVTQIPGMMQTTLNVTNISTDKVPGVKTPKEVHGTLIQRLLLPSLRKKMNPVTSMGVNVIPTYATITCDIRFNSIYDRNSLIEKITTLIPEDADLRVLNFQEFSSSSYKLIHNSVEAELRKVYKQEAFVSPILFIASSDNCFFRKHGFSAFGLSPIIVTLQDLERIHGDDERVNIHAFRKGCEDYYFIVKRMIESL
ncbi:hypothetical protein B6I21_09170 [candidate division KSB1 bacterium 4572_119]|nr:MAG: hypothetical protein B6I21_09170 [candidate division KSB1 bacterium 4572_119]